jgi:cyclopropane-fatty-acyl-phospholipid synthase
MSGALEVEGDLQSFIRLSFHPVVRDLQIRPRDKAKILSMYLRNRNSLRKARQNIHHHYDLGNDFYRLWLDESMTYSCAYWDDGCDSIEAAQRAKYEHICRKLQLKEGERLVDIGCGWGGMLRYAAEEYGVEGVGYTLSTEQHEFANDRLRADGLYPRVRVELLDYREAKGEFDKFVSIGMFEHVGKEYYGEFFSKVGELLAPGALGILHTIGKHRESDSDPWISKYIFPGSHLPTMGQIGSAFSATDLVLTDVENLRLHYAHTLDAWIERFEASIDEVRSRFDESFVRMWRFYLNASSAGFKWGDSRVYQVTFTNGLRSDLPLTRAHLYPQPANVL